MNSFQLQTKFNWYNNIQISKWKSLISGISIIFADIEGPLVEGAFMLPTEAKDNDGCPHTLEHIIFMGSELYPYKGILDKLANRCFASGTNAWTDTDHTAYTITTVGSEGFLNLLPIYLDHILYPTITDEAFHTEVHHITGDGNDAGVVYCEMQGRENTAVSRITLRMQQLLYPENCGYRYETGGLMANLRELKVEKVREFHKKFYYPNNLYLLISGKIEPQSVFKTLENFEQRILKKGNLYNYEKPWSSSVPPFTEIITEDIQFPSDDEETGIVLIAWRGPNWNEFEEINSLFILWKYLTDSAISPLHQVLIEIEDPYCNDITVGQTKFSEISQYVLFENAATEKINKIRDLFFSTIKNIIIKGIDMTRMNDIIKNSILQYYNKIEEEPHETFQFSSIYPLLYGTEEDFKNYFLSYIPIMENLKKKDNNYWVEIINKYILNKPFVCLNAFPSIELGKKMQKEEKERIKKQIELLGTEKLEQFKKKLEYANEKNNTPFPESILKTFKIPDVQKIPVIPVITIRNDEIINNKDPANDSEKIMEKLNLNEKLPFFIEFDQFVQLRAFLDTNLLDDNFREYIELYLDIIFESPILRDGILISHEEVIASLNRDSVTYSNSVGLNQYGNFSCGSFSQLIVFEMKFEINKYELAIKWLKEILWYTQFTIERLKIGASKLLADIAKHKRKGDYIAKVMLNQINFDSKKSNHTAMNLMRQQKFLKQIIKRLHSKNEANKVCQEFETFRNELCQPSKLRIQVVCNLLKINNPKKPWFHFLPNHFSKTDYIKLLQPVKFAKDFLTENTYKGNNAYIIGISAIESSFFRQSFLSPPYFRHEDEAPLIVLNEFLTAMEGPFWKEIRGRGLSYSYNIISQIEEGLLYFNLYKCTNPIQSYEVAYQIVQDIANKKIIIDDTTLETAKSGAVFSIMSREDTYENAAIQIFINFLKNVDPDENKKLLGRTQKVSLEDIDRVLKKYVLPLFNPKKSNIVISVNPSKIEEIVEGFNKLNLPITKVTKLEEFFK